MANQRIRIKLKGYDYRVVDQSTADIVDTLSLVAATISPSATARGA